MAIEEMREVQTPLDPAVEEATSDNDGNEGGDDGGGDSEPAPRAAQGQQARKPGQQGTRRDRRAAFVEDKKFREEFGGVKQNLQQTTQTLAEVRRELAAMRESAQRQQQQPAAQQQPQSSPVEQRVGTLREALQAEVRALRGHDYSKGQPSLEKYEALKEQYEDARHEMNMVKFLKARGVDPDRPPEPVRQVTRADIAQEAAATQMRQTMYDEHPWMTDRSDPQRHDERMRALLGTLNYLVDVEGRPNTLGTHREAAAMVERKYHLSPSRRAASPPRMPLMDGNRSRGGDDDGTTFEVPTAQLEGHGLSPEALRRVAARMAGGRGR